MSPACILLATYLLYSLLPCLLRFLYPCLPSRFSLWLWFPEILLWSGSVYGLSRSHALSLFWYVNVFILLGTLCVAWIYYLLSLSLSHYHFKYIFLALSSLSFPSRSSVTHMFDHLILLFHSSWMLCWLLVIDFSLYILLWIISISTCLQDHWSFLHVWSVLL